MRQRKRGEIGWGGVACVTDAEDSESEKGDRQRGVLFRPMKVGVKKSKAS